MPSPNRLTRHHYLENKEKTKAETREAPKIPNNTKQLNHPDALSKLQKQKLQKQK